MKEIDGQGLHYRELNQAIREAGTREIRLTHILGQRFIAAAASGLALEIEGIPGNALGAYLDGSTIRVHGNAQDALGDTMNDGEIIVEGSAGDAAGYAMRGGRLLIRENVGYRAGIHMKAYGDKVPALVIGGRADCFLGEYQAGGVILVLGLDTEGCPAGDYCATGMHGGTIFLRRNRIPNLPAQVKAAPATPEDMALAAPHLAAFSAAFGLPDFTRECFTVLRPDTDNPYRQMYTIC